MGEDPKSTIIELLATYQPGKSILSSVIAHDPAIEELLSKKTIFHKLSHLSKLPFSTPIGNPEKIGADRLAVAAAAVYYYPGNNNLVIGLGSCITYNLINKYNQFMGGSISPGMEMRFKALHTFTTNLPLIKADWNFPLIGYDTRSSILSGILTGMTLEVNGIIGLYKAKFNNFNVLLTGGDTPYFARHLKYVIFADPDLIFKGLYAISEHNNDAET